MRTCFVDTNLFIRYLTNDDTKKADRFYESLNVDFVDGYIAALMEKMSIRELYTFDRKHISRLQGIQRLEP